MLNKVSPQKSVPRPQLRRIESDFVSIADAHDFATDACVDRRMDRRARRRCEFRGAVDMIAMMMREQDRAKAQAFSRKRGKDRRRFTRIHSHGSAVPIREQPDDVVGKRGDGNETQVGHGGREYSQRAHGRR